ncbi:MAG: hypothetical protein LBD37_06860 [Treponema sp.]|jgi:hypothetical protein|nr:hypothetical protein [Treponema sp.]
MPATIAAMTAAVLAALCPWAAMGCASSGAPQPQPVVIPWEAAGAGGDAPLPRIRNETRHLDLGLRKQVDAIMQNYIDSQGEEYGYYTLHFGRLHDTVKGGINPGLAALIILGALGGASVDGISAATVYQVFRWYGRLSIYDSQGNSIGAFNTKGEFAPMVIGYSTLSSTDISDEETGKIYSTLLERIIKEALGNSAGINEQLRAAGPRSAANTPAALAKIHAQEEKIEHQNIVAIREFKEARHEP